VPRIAATYPGSTWRITLRRLALQTNLLLVVITGILVLAPAIGAQPPWAGGGKGEKDEQKGNREKQKSEKGDSDNRSSRDASTVRRGEYFGDQHRVVVQNYYHEQFRTGRCPPGLAKKGNGCMPPGQAKKWAIGRPLPRDVIFYEVPRELVVQIGSPPAGYRYARVANDILLIAVGTGMVIDAIQDLGRT
jgi:Ni/Co efflux regulator RcnB